MPESDNTQTETDGTDGGDKPPSRNYQQPKINGIHSAALASSASNGLSASSPKKLANGSTASQSGAHPRSAKPSNLNSTSHPAHSAYHPHVESPPNGSASPSSIGSPSVTMSDSDAFSPPPSRTSSRHPSMSNGKAGIKALDLFKDSSTQGHFTPPRSDLHTFPQGRPPGPPSNTSQDGSQGQKFTLKDLLNSAPKLSRKPSNRSASSRGSDSGRGPGSTGGDSTASLLKKYGVCERVAIGKGATSVVRLAHKWDRTEEKLYAVKEFRKRRKNETEKEYVKKLTAEFCISSTLHHINIVETVDLVQDEQQHWCEVMEYCPGGDLYAAIKKGGMSPSEVECCFRQILCGVAYLHSQGVAHRDIKPENLFFDARGHLKIGDYGASTVYRLPWEATVHMSTGLCGSEPYIAPEQFSGKPYDARLVDIWACGIVYYCLHFQELPWRVAQKSDPLYAAYAEACATCVQNGGNAASSPSTITNLSPRACRPVIRKMLEPNPKLRSTIEEVMAQPWVQGIEVCANSKSPSHIHVHATSMLQLHAEKVQ